MQRGKAQNLILVMPFADCVTLGMLQNCWGPSVATCKMRVWMTAPCFVRTEFECPECLGQDSAWLRVGMGFAVGGRAASCHAGRGGGAAFELRPVCLHSFTHQPWASRRSLNQPQPRFSRASNESHRTVPWHEVISLNPARLSSHFIDEKTSAGKSLETLREQIPILLPRGFSAEHGLPGGRR